MLVQQSDPTGRMTGQVQNGKTAIAKVDPVTFSQCCSQGCGDAAANCRCSSQAGAGSTTCGQVTEFLGKGFDPRQAG